MFSHFTDFTDFNLHVYGNGDTILFEYLYDKDAEIVYQHPFASDDDCVCECDHCEHVRTHLCECGRYGIGGHKCGCECGYEDEDFDEDEDEYDDDFDDFEDHRIYHDTYDNSGFDVDFDAWPDDE